MSINNAVYGRRDEVIGFRCFECNDIVPSMWGVVCNRCREAERRHNESLAAIRAMQRGDDQ